MTQAFQMWESSQCHVPLLEKPSLGWGSGGSSGVWHSVVLALGFLFSSWTVSGCCKSHAPASMEHLLHAELIAECTGKSARLPSMDSEKWETLGHGHCVQTASPPTFLTHPAKQEALREICFCLFVFSVTSMATDLLCSPTFANFRLGGFLFQNKASRTQAPPLVLTDGCHVDLVLGFNSVLPGLFVKLGPKTETRP